MERPSSLADQLLACPLALRKEILHRLQAIEQREREQVAELLAMFGVPEESKDQPRAESLPDNTPDNTEELERVSNIREAIALILGQCCRHEQQRIPYFDRMRDRIFAWFFNGKGIKKPPKRLPLLRTIPDLAATHLLYGFKIVNEKLRGDSEVFDQWHGEWAAWLLMTRLIAGKSLHHAHRKMARFRKQGMHATYALEIEGESDPKKQDQNLNRLIQETQRFETVNISKSDRHLSLKITAWSTNFHQTDVGFKKAYQGLEKIIGAAAAKGTFVTIDMEEYCYRDATIKLYKKLLEEHPEWGDHVGMVVQSYLKDSYKKTRRLIDWAREKKVPLNIRLVKGAYLEKERAESKTNGAYDPTCPSPEETNRQYALTAELMMKNAGLFGQMAFGTMNPETIAKVIELQMQHGVHHQKIEFQQLFGMADHLGRALTKLGYCVRKYVPYADRFSETISYFLRRLDESPGQRAMLQQAFSGNSSKLPGA